MRLSLKGIRLLLKKQKKVLRIRLYKLLGVKPLGEGLFEAK